MIHSGKILVDAAAIGLPSRSKPTTIGDSPRAQLEHGAAAAVKRARIAGRR
jgi:hypothetical protein